MGVEWVCALEMGVCDASDVHEADLKHTPHPGQTLHHPFTSPSSFYSSLLLVLSPLTTMELSGILPEDHIAYGKHGPDAHIPLSLRYADLTHPSTSTLTLLWDVWQLDQPIEHHVSARTRSMDRHFGYVPPFLNYPAQT